MDPAVGTAGAHSGQGQLVPASGGESPGLALYVHIPFCETKCPYCDFNTYTGIESLIPRYVDALGTELRHWGHLLERPLVGSIFFGGGTPSYIPERDTRYLADQIAESFAIAPGAEVTLEANPGDFDRTDPSSYLRAGFNRLSIGAQSFDDGLLRGLGRRHDAAGIELAVHKARAAGFDNLSLDLMFGLPDQTLAQWEASLHRAIQLGPEHLSLYALTLEPGTPLEAAVRAGHSPEPDADLAADMYLLAEDSLSSAGYLHYEISNWAVPGRPSVHNLAYWRCEPYLGVGPGAHSYILQRRFSCVRSPRTYTRLLLSVPFPETRADPLRAMPYGPSAHPVDVMAALGALTGIEDCTPAAGMADFMMMGLRLHEGVGSDRFAARFGVPLRTPFASVIDELTRDGLIEVGGPIRLTRRGRLLGNEVFSRFVVAAHEFRTTPDTALG